MPSIQTASDLLLSANQRLPHPRWPKRQTWQALVFSMGLCATSFAQAGLFADNEARRAILDLRQRYQTLSEENAAMRESLQDAQNKLKALSNDMAKLRSRNEQLTRELTSLRKQTSAQYPDALMPENALAIGGTASSSPVFTEEAAQEKTLFDAALNKFRGNDYSGARSALRTYLQKYPQSGKRIAALYWLGNSEYALRNYRSAMNSYRAVVTQAPNHERAPEALLALSTCQVELRDLTGARATLEQLISTYPNSEASQAARDRLTRLR